MEILLENWESKMNYIDYKGLLKFEVFSRKKGYRNLVDMI